MPDTAGVSVEADADNPRCVWWIFATVYGLNQIWLSAHITV